MEDMRQLVDQMSMPVLFVLLIVILALISLGVLIAVRLAGRSQTVRNGTANRPDQAPRA